MHEFDTVKTGLSECDNVFKGLKCYKFISNFLGLVHVLMLGFIVVLGSSEM